MIQIDMEMSKNCMECPFMQLDMEFYDDVCTIVEENIYDAEKRADFCPLIDADAKWIPEKRRGCIAYYTCTSCGETSEYSSDYCPNCGARMVTEVKDI